MAYNAARAKVARTRYRAKWPGREAALQRASRAKDPAKCRAQARKHARASYARDPERWRRSYERCAARLAERLRGFKTKPCTDCHKSYPPHVMQFDHVNPEAKVAGVSNLSRRKLEILLAEIAKCELVCANCHAERTYQRRKPKEGK